MQKKLNDKYVDREVNYIRATLCNKYNVTVLGYMLHLNLLCETGLSTAQSVHSNPSTATADDRRLLANVVGTQFYHCRYVDQAARDGQGR